MDKRVCLVLALMFLFLFFLKVNFGYAQAELSFAEEEKKFYLDYAVFKESSDSSRLEIYYQIFNSELAFLKMGEKYKANYEIELTISDREKKQVTASSLEKEYWVESYQESQNPESYVIHQTNLFLPSGRFRLVAQLNDKNSTNQIKIEKNIIVPLWGEKELDFSDIEFCKSIEEMKDSSQFSKQGKNFIPSVSLTFGENAKEMLLFYELYPNNPELKEVKAWFLAKDRSNKKVLEDSALIPLTSPVVSQIKRISMEILPLGDYTLEVKWQDKKGKVLAKTQKEFEMDWSILSQLKADYAKTVDLLRYVANSKERDELKKAKPEERVQKWNEFWKSKDPTPNTPENELEEEYFKRVKFTNENFAILDKEGWQTDMGMVYIKFGKPDEVEKHPFERETKPYQVWYYYRLNKKFLFVDETGYGEYELKYPYDGRLD